MTSSSVYGRVALLAGALCVAQGALAALGAPHAPRAVPASAGAVQRALAASVHYTVQELLQPDGSRVQELVAPNGVVFAVRWNTLYKPDLSQWLGSYFSGFAGAAQQSAQRGGLQRQFRHDNADLVVQSTGHLHVFSGYAYVRSLMPAGVTPRSLGWE